MQILLIIAIVAVITLFIWILQRVKVHPKRRWVSNARTSDDSLPRANALVPALLNLLVTQMMQSQPEHHERDTELFWAAQEISNDFASLPDNTWDM